MARADDEPAVDDRFEQAVLALLEEGGPRPIGWLVAQLDRRGELDFLRDEGVDEDELEAAVADELMHLGEVWETPDGTLAALSQLTDGLVLTHRISADELAQGGVVMTPDLVGLDYDVPGNLELSQGGRLLYQSAPATPGEDASTFVGPDGWLDGFAAGDLLAFRRSGVEVIVERVTAAPSGEDDDQVEDEVELLRSTIDGRIPVGQCEEAAPLLFDALAHAPAAFRRPVRPLGELLAAAGLEQRGFSFGRSGAAWQSRGEQHRLLEDERLARKWHFDSCCAAAFRSVRAAFDALEAGPTTHMEDARAIAEALAHGTVGPAFADRVLGTRVGGDDHLAAFAGRLAEAAPDHLTAPAHLLLALDAERRGDATSAEAALRTAGRVDPDYGAAAMELVVYELDRGDVRSTLKLLRHSDASPESELLGYLEAFLASVDAPYRGVGRNERCPCGSGRKFKTCCQQAPPAVPLSQRIGLLSRKLVVFLRRDHRRPRLVGVATSACDPDADDFLTRLSALSESSLIVDLVAFEGGGVEDYLDERGALLPDDERGLLERLVEEPRRLWEVTAVKPDRSILVRSVDDGEPCEVTAKATDKPHEPGDLLLARQHGLADAANPFFGIPLMVPPSLRDDALRLVASRSDADTLAAFVGRML